MAHTSIASRIRAFRKLKGLTQQELSDKVNISISVIGSIERGTRKPDERILSRIADVLGVSLDELVGESTSAYGSK